MPSPSPPPPRRGLESFASRDFRRYQLARVMAILGAEAQAVAVAWQVYSITHRPLDLGYTGLALFLPGLLFLLPAGHVADRFDRRQVILVCYSLQILCTSGLLAITLHGVRRVFPIYAVLFLIGTGRSFSGPASSAFIPHLVPEKHFVNAVTWGGAIFQFANTTGPALGGILFTLPLVHLLPTQASSRDLAGAGIVYCFTLLTLFWFVALISTLRVRPGRMEHRAASLKVVLAGFQYVRHMPMLLGSFSLDLFVVLLGGAVTLMPIFANDILHTGPRGLGVLRAAPAVGALATSVVLARFPLQRRAGHRLFFSVAIFGAATVVFGLSRNLWLSLLSLAILGSADMISVIIRGSVLQLATPPEMRGRVSAVNSLFIGASNELGEFESGLTAQWWGAVRATVYGGIGSLLVAGIWAGLFPSLRQADELTAESLRRQAPGAEKPAEADASLL
ncbi:MAG TPA: MFS transporter [Terracidiphilus sp.]|jgi:MFS family permease|nr:MFS transporter [Terracidiphilus sp.]